MVRTLSLTFLGSSLGLLLSVSSCGKESESIEYVCGNGQCEPVQGESCANCPNDCGPCSPSPTTTGATFTGSNSDSNSGTTTVGTETGFPTTTATTGFPTTTTAGTGGSGDPGYPAPDGEICPPGTALASFEEPGVICVPECVDTECPIPETGDAVGLCLYDADASYTPCETREECPAEETCQVIMGGTTACYATPSHCLLLCFDGQTSYTCPDGMECTASGVCQYPG